MRVVVDSRPGRDRKGTLLSMMQHHAKELNEERKEERNCMNGEDERRRELYLEPCQSSQEEKSSSSFLFRNGISIFICLDGLQIDFHGIGGRIFSSVHLLI